MTIKARIALHIEQTPERYKLADGLRDMLQMKEGSRTAIVNAIWSYIKLHKLQDKVDRRAIKADGRIRYVRCWFFTIKV